MVGTSSGATADCLVARGTSGDIPEHWPSPRRASCGVDFTVYCPRVHSAELQRLVDAGDVPALFRAVSAEQIADAWWRYTLRPDREQAVDHPDWWAVELWFGSAIYQDDFRDDRRSLIHALAERAPQGADLGLLGAGPVENCVADNEDDLLWMEAEARHSENYRKALANVWIDGFFSPESFLRVEAAAGTRLSWSERQGPRPTAS